MQKNIFKLEKADVAWCPGCGNFGLRAAMLETFDELGLKQDEVVFVSGIGQAAKAPQYYDGSFFNGLHGRSLPAATGIKSVNPELTVIVESGDGDMYGEGGNHLLHAIRRNPDITVIVHNNMIYGLTKGQASPTSQLGMTTPVQVDGVIENPLNPIALAISLGGSFVARSSVHEKELTKELVKKAIEHPGFALVDIFQSCITFNKVNTPLWFKENTYITDHDPTDKIVALTHAFKEGPWPLGLFYKRSIDSFEKQLSVYKRSNESMVKCGVDKPRIVELLKEYA